MRGSFIFALVLSILMSTPAVAQCGDLTLDRDCDLEDLAILLGAYGWDYAGDLDHDGDTDLSDLSILLAHFGSSTPTPVVVDELSVPAELVAGSTYEMRFVVRNEGDCYTTVYPWIWVFWSADDTPSDDDFVMMSGAWNLELQVGETFEAEWPSMPVPCETPAGAGFVILQMDWIGHVSSSAAASMVVGECE